MVVHLYIWIVLNPQRSRIVVAADDSNRGELMEYRTLANACASSLQRISHVPVGLEKDGKVKGFRNLMRVCVCL